MLSKTRNKVIAAAAIAAALVVGPVLPAFADQGAAIIGSQAYYVTSSNRLTAQDTQSDGKSAIAEIRASSGSTIYSVTESDGVGQIAVRIISMPANYQIRACVKDYSAGTAKSCGPWVNGD